MAKLIYSMQTSMDGYMEDSEGKFDFGFPTPELHQFFNDQLRSSGTHLYGRRLYETMAVWETMGLGEEVPDEHVELEAPMVDFA
ncbi:MAG: dihydrofolate reductase family protein, partial [Solirubrobacterales bacterium]